MVGSLDTPVSGSVTTEKRSKIGIGIVELVISHKKQSFRAREAVLDDTEDSGWVEVRGNTSLGHLLSKYGADLIGYDSHRHEMTLELLAFELFERNTRSVRILLRRPPAP